jgi:hypothetical protein
MAMEVLQYGPGAVVAAGAGTTTVIVGEVPAHESEGGFQLERVSFTSQTLITGNGLATINIRQVRAGSQVSAAIATLLLATTTGNLPAETPVVIPIVGSGATAPVLLAGDVLECTYVQTSTGLALTIGWRVAVEID